VKYRRKDATGVGAMGDRDDGVEATTT